MPIYINNKKMKAGLIGSTPIKKIYRGFKLVWSAAVQVTGTFQSVQLFYKNLALSPPVTIGDGQAVIIPHNDILSPIEDLKGTYKITVNTLDGVVYDSDDNEMGYAYPTPSYSDGIYTSFNGFAIDYWTPEDELGPGTYYVRPVADASIIGLAVQGAYTTYTNVTYIPNNSENKVTYTLDDYFIIYDDQNNPVTYIFSSEWNDNRPDAANGIFELS